MKIKLLLLLIGLFYSISNFAQTEDAWVYFVDKPNAATQIASPLTILTQRALDRRTKQSISLDTRDAPLESSYVAAIAGSTGITVLARSKWLNALHIQGLKANIDNLINLEIIPGIKIIDSIEFADRSLMGLSNKTSKSKKIAKWEKYEKITTSYSYGSGFNQIDQLNGIILHENNFTGAGMQIAVMDAGFPNVDTFEAFRYIRENNQILGGYDFVNRSSNYFSGHSHGRSVLSTMAGYLENGINGSTIDYVGTAPDAEYYLFITEDAVREVRLEESMWVEAAERADSLGVDVINTSLGYSIFFDNTAHNYAYADMDGQTAFITRGAEVAFSRGMILVTSAGNEGNSSPWKYINAPADGPSVLTIGAVNSAGTIAGFSSFGPTSDGRIKPDVCAQGQGAYIVNGSTSVGSSNGTSFSSPIMTGAVACLWQAFPTKTNAEIIQYIKESGHLYGTPNDQEGYGIPDFEGVYNNILSTYNEDSVDDFSVYPNPVNNHVFIKFPFETKKVEVAIYNVLGKQQLQQLVNNDKPFMDISYLPGGLYILKITDETSSISFKIIKN